MGKKKCCLKYEKKGKQCKSCPIQQLEGLFEDELKKRNKKNKKKKNKVA